MRKADDDRLAVEWVRSKVLELWPALRWPCDYEDRVLSHSGELRCGGIVAHSAPYMVYWWQSPVHPRHPQW